MAAVLVVWRMTVTPGTPQGPFLGVVSRRVLGFGNRYLIRVDMGWEGTSAPNTIEVDVR